MYVLLYESIDLCSYDQAQADTTEHAYDGDENELDDFWEEAARFGYLAKAAQQGWGYLQCFEVYHVGVRVSR